MCIFFKVLHTVENVKADSLPLQGENPQQVFELQIIVVPCGENLKNVIIRL